MRSAEVPMLAKIALFLVACFAASVSGVSGAQPLLDQPDIQDNTLRSGEVLKYSVSLRGIPAGTQTLQVNGRRLLDGHEVYHVESVSRARRLFSIFYPFSNRSESFIHSESFYPLHYRKNIRDGGYRGSTDVDFDRVNRVARITKDQKYMELPIPEGTQDELSMLYLLRTKEMEVGRKYEFPALIGAEVLKASIEVLRVEELKTALGTLKTIVIRAIPKDITVWLTDDNDRIPVRIEISTKLGKLVSNLREIR